MQPDGPVPVFRPGVTRAQPGPTQPGFVLDERGNWVAGSAPAPGSDEAVVAEGRRLIAQDEPGKAVRLLTDWLSLQATGDSPVLADAYLTRGDAWVASGDEFEALYDYETVIKFFPGSRAYVTALERELDIAVRYLNGLDRRWFGFRIVDASDVATELLIRVHERLPGSRLAERAGIELADYYYRQRELKLAGEAYELFNVNFPQSSYRQKASERRIYSRLGQFKGPRYDGTPLVDADVLLRRYAATNPSQEAKAQGLLSWIDESRGDQLLEQARWYLKRNDAVSARATLVRLRLGFPMASASKAAEALMDARGWTMPESAAGAKTGTTPGATPGEAPGEKTGEAGAKP